MVSFQVKQLASDATESQIKEIVDFSTKAFRENAAMKASLGGDWSLHSELETAMLRASLLEGVVYIVTVGTDEKIVSAGYWFGKGHVMFGSEEQRALGYDAFFEKISEEARTWAIKTFPMIKEMGECHFTKEEIAKRWWCSHLATHPEHQGKGYATAIINTMFKRAKAERSFIALETGDEVNVRKYHSMGFKSRGKGHLIPTPFGDYWIYFLAKGSLVSR